MRNLFFKTKNFASNRTLPKLSNVRSLIQEYEKTAYAHWVFGTDSSSFTDKVNGKNLTLQGSATVNPSFIDNALVLSNQLGNALLTDFVDTSSQNLTMSAVVKATNASLNILFGNLVQSSSTGTSGLGGFVTSNLGYLTLKPTSAIAGTTGVNSLTTGSQINQQQYFFIAMSVDKITNTTILYVKQNSVSGGISKTYTTAYETSMNPIAIGNSVYQSGSTVGDIYIAESILYSKALDLTELEALANSATQRMSDRGIQI